MIIVVIGRRELGKTTLATYLAHKRTPRLIIDPRAQWDSEQQVVYRAFDFDAMLDDLQSGRDVVVQPIDLQITIDQTAKLANFWFQERTVADGARKLSVVFDEAGLYELRSWDWMMRCSPRAYTSIVLTAHRPSDISTSIRALADTWCIFRTTQRHDLDAIAERCGELVERQVQDLRPYEFVAWDDAKAEMTVHRNPAAWRTPDTSELVGEVIEEKRPRKVWEM
jgi:hypothetical protein